MSARLTSIQIFHILKTKHLGVTIPKNAPQTNAAKLRLGKYKVKEEVNDEIWESEYFGFIRKASWEYSDALFQGEDDDLEDNDSALATLGATTNSIITGIEEREEVDEEVSEIESIT